jgi:hypothetical protein
MDQLTTNLQSNAPSARPTETPLGTHETDAGDLGERHDLGSGQGRKMELAMPDPLVENILARRGRRQIGCRESRLG